LAEEIPAPVEFDLDLDHPPSIEICRRLLGLSRAEPMLFIGESIDRGQHGVVGCHVIPPGDVGPVAF
jgi:hypothetical protein